jgi:rhodanese-related sulfurtransferase
MEAHRIRASELRQRLEAGEEVVLVDTRSPDAWARTSEMAAGAMRIPADKVAHHLAELPRGRTIVTYCT